MDNKEKEQYIGDMQIYRSHPYSCELSKRNEFAKKMPKTLYKYRSFDKWTYEMLDESYVYLTPVKDLDDPFDCLTNPGINGNEKDSDSIGLAKADFIIDVVSDLGNVNFDKKQVKEIVLACYTNGEFDKEKARSEIKKLSSISDKEKELFFNTLNNIDDSVRVIINDNSMKSLTNIAINSKEQVGICSLSTKRDNKVMWSLYSNKYSGYCVEYDVPTNDKELRFSLYPVIYKTDNEDFIKKLLKFAIANYIRFLSDGQRNRGIGSIYELFCTKEECWEYQDEWRIIGNPKNHCKKLKVKAVYLGFNTSKNHIQKIREIALKKCFDVYLMDTPKDSKNISYKKL